MKKTSIEWSHKGRGKNREKAYNFSEWITTGKGVQHAVSFASEILLDGGNVFII